MSDRQCVDEFYRQQVKLYRCLGVQRPLQDKASLWRRYARHLHSLVVLSWMLLFDASLVAHLIDQITSLNEIFKVFFIFATALGVLGKYVSLALKGSTYDAIYSAMHYCYGSGGELSAVELTIVERSIHLSRRNRNLYAGLSLMALNAVLLTQYLTDRTQLPMTAYVPFEITSIVCYAALYVYQYVAVFILCLINIAYDSLATSLFIYLGGQVEVLAYRLSNINGKHANFSDDGAIERHLKNSARHYAQLHELTQSIEQLMSGPMSVQVLCSVLVLIANFYAMSFLSEPGDYATFAKFFIYQICMLTQIFILCYFSNELSLKSVQLVHALYSEPWYCWNDTNRKLVLLLLLRLNKPIQIKMVNRCYAFNLTAFTSIVNLSYSYFALLKRMNSS